ncbi:GlxA family transcriptional regulator [Geminicoccus roseus]|uniref:GlxA family transcriptional regulator n=1 Tax=Geminicoccus roseus TaxID=404900 RepID=UPI0003F4EA0A|nr:GlxA family transcriptional regulator [Geminicoccus roseus]
MLDPTFVTAPDTVGFLLLDRFSMMAFTSALEPLRVANRVAGRELYRWRIFSLDGLPVRASNGLMVVADEPLSASSQMRSLLVVASFEPERHAAGPAVALLRRLARFGIAMGALDTGAWPLAAAGLLDHHRITLHWEAAPAFAATFPKVELSPRLYEIDRNRFTSAGGTSPFDMMLHLIGRRHGETLVRSITEQLVAATWRAGDLPQRPTLANRLGVRHARLGEVLAAIELDPSESWSLAVLARRTGISPRALTTLFRRETGTSPHRFILQLRLLKARDQLAATSRSIRDVALDCGFASLEHFSRSFHRQFGTPPSALRRR